MQKKKMICRKKQIKSLYRIFLPKFLLQSFRTLSNNTSGHFWTALPGTFNQHSNSFEKRFSSCFGTVLWALLQLFLDSSRAIKQFFSLMALLWTFLFNSKQAFWWSFGSEYLTRCTNLVSSPSGAPHTGHQWGEFVLDESQHVVLITMIIIMTT